MTEDTKSSIEGGLVYVYAMIVVILLALSSGCISSQYENSDYDQNPPATTSKTTVQASEAPTITQATSSTTIEGTVQTGFSKVSVAVDGCDDDYYGNAMVAGYVTNNGVKMIDAVPIVTQLLTSEGEVVSGGEKTTVITNLKPGENQKLSVIYEKPPQWKKCRASVNGDWLA